MVNRAIASVAFAHRHYEALAKVLGATKPTDTAPETLKVTVAGQDVPDAMMQELAEAMAEVDRNMREQWDLMVKEITKMLAQDNPAFNIDRFIKAVHQAKEE